MLFARFLDLLILVAKDLPENWTSLLRLILRWNRRFRGVLAWLLEPLRQAGCFSLWITLAFYLLLYLRQTLTTSKTMDLNPWCELLLWGLKRWNSMILVVEWVSMLFRRWRDRFHRIRLRQLLIVIWKCLPDFVFPGWYMLEILVVLLNLERARLLENWSSIWYRIARIKALGEVSIVSSFQPCYCFGDPTRNRGIRLSLIRLRSWE